MRTLQKIINEIDSQIKRCEKEILDPTYKAGSIMGLAAAKTIIQRELIKQSGEDN